MAVRAGQAFVEIYGTTERLTHTLHDAEEQIRHFVQSVGLATAAAGAGFTASLIPAINEASHQAIYLDTFRQVFDGANDAADRLANTISQKMNRSLASIAGAMAPIGKIARGLGMSADEAAKFSAESTQAAFDLASGWGISMEDAAARIRSAMTGSTGALEAYGVNLKETALSAELAAMGLESNTAKATDLEKALARLSIIQHTLSAAGLEGNFERNLGRYDILLQGLSDAFKRLKAAIGETVLPFAEFALKGLNRAINAMADFIKSTPRVVQVLTGLSVIAVAAGLSLALLFSKVVFGTVKLALMAGHTVHLVTWLKSLSAAGGLASKGASTLANAVSVANAAMVAASPVAAGYANSLKSVVASSVAAARGSQMLGAAAAKTTAAATVASAAATTAATAARGAAASTVLGARALDMYSAAATRAAIASRAATGAVGAQASAMAASATAATVAAASSLGFAASSRGAAMAAGGTKEAVGDIMSALTTLAHTPMLHLFTKGLQGGSAAMVKVLADVKLGVASAIGVLKPLAGVAVRVLGPWAAIAAAVIATGAAIYKFHQITGAFLPFFEAFSQAGSIVSAVFSQNVMPVFRQAAALFSGLWTSSVKEAGTAFAEFSRQMKPLVEGIGKLFKVVFVGTIEYLMGRLALFMEGIEKVLAGLNKLLGFKVPANPLGNMKGNPEGEPQPPGSSDKKAKPSDELQQFADRVIEDIKTPAERFKETVKLINEAMKADLLTREQANKKFQQAMKERDDALNREWEDSAEGKFQKEMDTFAQKLSESTRTADEKFRDELAKIGRAFHAGAITAELANRGIAAAQAELAEANQKIADEQKRRLDEEEKARKERRKAELDAINDLADRRRKIAKALGGQEGDDMEMDSYRRQYNDQIKAGFNEESLDALTAYLGALIERSNDLDKKIDEQRDKANMVTASAREAVWGLGKETVDQQLLAQQKRANALASEANGLLRRTATALEN